MSEAAPRLYNLVAELTYRCPLRCPYCSNPVALADFPQTLDTAAWCQVMQEAAELGAVHVGLTGGEPTVRRDLAQIVAAAAGSGLYTHLVTAGLPLAPAGLDALVDAGLRSVQLSIQDALPTASDATAGLDCFDRKRRFAAAVRERALPLSLNVVLHRHNLDRVAEIIELARELDVERLELANVQYHGWAFLNREKLLPTREQLEGATRAVRAARAESATPEIVFVLADHHADRPKPCCGGWGRRQLVVSPDGRVLPCHAASEIPGLDFWRVGERPLADCWRDSPGMNAFRGESWMPEPCRSCDERTRDFGGCRCQAYAITGSAHATDPACALAPQHDRVRRLRDAAETAPAPGDPATLDWIHRSRAASPGD